MKLIVVAPATNMNPVECLSVSVLKSLKTKMRSIIRDKPLNYLMVLDFVLDGLRDCNISIDIALISE